MQFANNIIPDPNNPIVKFNFYYCTDYMPKIIQDFNNGGISFDKLISLSNISGNLQVKCLDSQKISGKIIQISIPSTKAVSETALVLVFFSNNNNKASLFTCEYSLDCYMICSSDADGNHSNYGQVYSLDEACDYCINLLPKDFFPSTVKKQIDESYNEHEEDNTFSIKSATKTEDIYGGKLIERLDSIYFVIQDGVEEMMKWLIEYPNKKSISIKKNDEDVAKMLYSHPIPSEKGKIECQIIMASLLTSNIDTEIVAKSLINGCSSLSIINLNTLVKMLEVYNHMYKTFVLMDYVKQQWTLTDFARKNGKLKIGTFNKPDKYGNLKRPVFINDKNEKIICQFNSFDENQQTANFIVSNQYNIFVQKRVNGDFEFVLKDNIDINRNNFFDFLLYKIYFTPLTYSYYIWRDDIVKAIKRLNISSNEINPVIEQAFNEGKKIMELIATSTGLIGTYNN